MLETIADSDVPAWSVAVVAVVVAAAHRFELVHRRRRLNRALHELRRPLQALTLALPPQHGTELVRGQLQLAVDAVSELDRELNGGAPAERRAIDVRDLVERAVSRWRDEAALARRPLRLAWRANGSRVVCDPAAIGRALDNLIANSLEHGRGTITVEATGRSGRLRLVVADGGTARIPRGPTARIGPPRGLANRWGDPRHGHGLRVVADVAASHGGRFAACRDRGGAAAVLELPLAGR